MSKRTIYPGERQALAIRQARAAASKLSDLSTLVAINLDTISTALPAIIATDDCPDLKRALTRIDDLRQLRNQMELGAFNIALSNALDAAFQRLP